MLLPLESEFPFLGSVWEFLKSTLQVLEVANMLPPSVLTQNKSFLHAVVTLYVEGMKINAIKGETWSFSTQRFPEFAM